jgi:Family of unknown function (DUF5994)
MPAPPLKLETTQARRWTIAHPRLRLKPAHHSAGFVQGAWWPLTDQLYIELRHLLAALSSRSGTIERVIYDENSWASASLRIEFRGHSVILEPSNTSPNTLTVSGKKFGTLVLLVVPPNTDPTAAHAAVMAAAEPTTCRAPRNCWRSGCARRTTAVPHCDRPPRWDRRRNMTPIGASTRPTRSIPFGNHK